MIAAKNTVVARAPATKVSRVNRKALVCRADGAFIGSTTNIIMVASTGLCLAAARFGLAPSAKNGASANLKLSERPVDLMSSDPSGFTAADVLAMGAAGHGIGIGIVLGLKGIGAL
ncbi:hypothetical protein CEUSTIGMA_g9827.t1 [Chlamydomonas eustigma]|uniref:PSI-K n=1 Tax=Chlamydomonas eustigma TaxID=1157962 RepID=A0A250XHK0_9CHLO|nr:hypothetical protein CEUSTIGMA_g9827.t1 [Chlamydomonas eustigma]|eukprot:GAX82399.1 hypothetical protein CEUSTIGMA_g9827.t1 [Chlamydomonas eustigma]